MFKGALIAGLMCVGCTLVSAPALAKCLINNQFGDATHFLVNGMWLPKGGHPRPEIRFKVPGADVGNGIVYPDSVSHAGDGGTAALHVRLRLNAKSNSPAGVTMYFDSSNPLSCGGCSSNVTIPFSKFGWTERNSGNMNNRLGAGPGDGQLTGSDMQYLIYAQPSPGYENSDNIFNLKFNFANDEIFPPGTYQGTFRTRGIPDL